jgi:hypothetical protein
MPPVFFDEIGATTTLIFPNSQTHFQKIYILYLRTISNALAINFFKENHSPKLTHFKMDNHISTMCSKHQVA